jgi:hypothetical protein
MEIIVINYVLVNKYGFRFMDIKKFRTKPEMIFSCEGRARNSNFEFR